MWTTFYVFVLGTSQISYNNVTPCIVWIFIVFLSYKAFGLADKVLASNQWRVKLIKPGIGKWSKHTSTLAAPVSRTARPLNPPHTCILTLSHSPIYSPPLQWLFSTAFHPTSPFTHTLVHNNFQRDIQCLVWIVPLQQQLNIFLSSGTKYFVYLNNLLDMRFFHRIGFPNYNILYLSCSGEFCTSTQKKYMYNWAIESIIIEKY